MHRYDRRSRALAVCLSALAGYVDALGFLALGGFFISFMSGNSTRLGVGVVEDLHNAGIAVGIIISFVAGVIAGTLVGQRSGQRRQKGVLLVVALLLLLAGTAQSIGLQTPAIVFMALAMGAENAVFERDGDVGIGLTYMTGALVKMGQRIAGAFSGGDRLAFLPYFILWLGLVAGAAAGSAAYAFIGLNGLWVAAALAVMLSLAPARQSKKAFVDEALSS